NEQIEEATGPDGAHVTLRVTAKSAGNADLTPICTPSSGSLFPLGTTYVDCTATDNTVIPALTSAITFRVTVRDTTPPTITVPDAFSVPNTSASGAKVTYGAAPRLVSVTDLVSCPEGDASRHCDVTCTPPSEETFPLGKSTVTCQAMDAAGNQGFAHFELTVRDFGPPLLTLEDMPVKATNGIGERAFFPKTPGGPPSALDPEEGVVSVDCSPPSGTLFLLGETTVRC